MTVFLRVEIGVERVISQPVDHADIDGPKFEQQIFIIVPQKASITSPVFFVLGNEQDLTKRGTLSIYKAYGKPKDIIFIAAEHRGYGQSVTFDKDQTVPSYICIDQALADYHDVVETLKEEYPGPWMAAGYSYGGSLAINFAFEYPDDVKVILSSSGAVDFPFVTDSWDRKLRIYYGERFYKRLAKHINYYKPQRPFAKDWVNREFLSDVCAVIPQKQRYQRYKNLLRLISYLPTQTFLKVTIWMDNKLNYGKGLQEVQSITKKTLDREEAITGKFSWRVWRYQQCTETGLFLVSENSNGLFPSRSHQDIYEECEALFGKKQSFMSGKQWSPREMLKRLTVPIIYVGGGKDPSCGMLEADYKIKNGKYIYIPDGRHCPDLSDPKVGKEVLSGMLRFIKGNGVAN